MTPTQGQIIRMQGVLAVAVDNCVWPIVDQKRYLFWKKEKELAIKIKTGVSKGKLNRSFLDYFFNNSFRRIWLWTFFYEFQKR